MVNKSYKFSEMSLGGQLLVWSSRLIYSGIKNKIDNSYLITMAYLNVRVNNGYMLQYNFLSRIIENNNQFNLMNTNCPTLNRNEILLRNCILDFSKNNFYKDDYISIWKLEKNSIFFFLSARDFSLAYKNANLLEKHRNDNLQNISNSN